MFTLSAFADEIDPDPQEQIDVLKSCGVRHIELRSILKTNVLDLTDLQIAEFKSLLDKHGFKLSAIGSPIGKIKIDAAVRAAPDSASSGPSSCARSSARRTSASSATTCPTAATGTTGGARCSTACGRDGKLAEKAGVRLLHENEHGIYGDSPERVRDLMETVPEQPTARTSRAVYDPANYVFCGYDPWQGWQMTKE